MLVSQLDEQASAESPCTSVMLRGERFLMAALPPVAAVAVWYLSSISITFINKSWLTDLDFDYPFTTASVDNAVVALIAYLATRLPCLRQPALGWRLFVRVVVPVGVCTALDVVSGLIFYLEYEEMSPTQLGLVLGGTVTTLLGVVVGLFSTGSAKSFATDPTPVKL